jgi:hypothetical protein
MRSLLLLSLTLLSCWAVEAEKLPADVLAIIDKAETAEAAAQNEADAKIFKVKQALIRDLTKLQETYTKKGNLDAAMGIKARIDSTQAYLNKQILDDKESKNSASVVGTWGVYNTSWKVGTISLKADKTCLGGNGDSGTWSIQNDTLTIRWYNGNENRGSVSADIVMVGGKGASFSMRKINE